MSIHNNTNVRVLLERLKNELRDEEVIKKSFYIQMLMLISPKVTLQFAQINYLELILLSIKFDNEFFEVPPEAEDIALAMAIQQAKLVNSQYMNNTK